MDLERTIGSSVTKTVCFSIHFFSLPSQPQQTLPLWLRKIGAFSVQEVAGGISNIKNSGADLICDTWTRAPLLHALISEDAEPLRLIYRIFLESGLQPKRFVHVLQSFDPFACEWAEFAFNPKKQFRYCEEYITGELLQKKLRKEDLSRLAAPQLSASTWTGYCASALGIKDFASQREKITQAHLLLTFFYALQPGAFSFSVSDLVGALPDSPPLLRPNGSKRNHSLS